MPLEESVENFHPIDINIFDKNTDLVFNIFYKAQDASEDRFVLYASKEPRYRDKVRELLQSPDFMEELFIHEVTWVFILIMLPIPCAIMY